MHVLARGDILQRLRLASGLVLFTFAATHFLNHALGLVSLDAMQAMQAWRKVVTRSWIGSGLLLAAFLIHILLGALQDFAAADLEAAPVGSGADHHPAFRIPLFLITHVVYNRGAATLAGTDDTYAYELGNIWPRQAWEHSAAAAGRVGARLHRHALLVEPRLLVRPRAAATVCACGGAAGERARGLHGGGARGGGPPRGAGRLGEAAGCLARARCGRDHTPRPRCTTGCALTFLALLGPRPARARSRSVRRAAGAKVEITYRGGPVVRVPQGPTLLEISRMNDVPHASVCGGRARCSTCRVGVESGLADLMPPGSAEAATLASIMAPPHVRLACQIRPHRAITVTRLVAPPHSAQQGSRPAGHPQGIERNLAVLFLDTRGFTKISETRLPYDVVFILNRLFAQVGEAIERHDGVIDKYLGDGLMAIFGGRAGEAAGCRQALRAARDIDLGLDGLNREIASEIGVPLKIGMGIDVGPLVVGQIGHVGTASVTVIGNTVNAASRLEALTKDKGCQLIVATDVLAHAGLRLDAFPREDVAIRGLSAPRSVALIGRARDLPDIPEPLSQQDERATSP